VYGYLLQGLDLYPFADGVAQQGGVEGAHVCPEVVHLLRGWDEGQVFTEEL